MYTSAHLLAGASIFAMMPDRPVEAAICAFLSHPVLDLIGETRMEYPIIARTESVAITTIIGIGIVAGNLPVVFLGGFFANLPDIFLIINIIFGKLLREEDSEKLLNLHCIQPWHKTWWPNLNIGILSETAINLILLVIFIILMLH